MTMDAATIARLNDLNRRFYRRHAAAFDAKRRAPWPGWERIVASPAAGGRPAILDVGCGNARYGLEAERRLGRPVDYVGLDASRELLRLARARTPSHWRFVEADFVACGLPLARECRFDLVTCFGVLHHVPGEAVRAALLTSLAARLAPGGRLAVSFWRFGERRRFRGRALDRHAPGGWPVEGLDTSELEANDYRLPWGEERPDRPWRYCHWVDGEEIERLVTGIGLRRLDEYTADGRSGDLNHYCVLERD